MVGRQRNQATGTPTCTTHPESRLLGGKPCHDLLFLLLILAHGFQVSGEDGRALPDDVDEESDWPIFRAIRAAERSQDGLCRSERPQTAVDCLKASLHQQVSSCLSHVLFRVPP